MRRRALFLDRDGVLNEPVWDAGTGSPESPLSPSDVVLTDGAAGAVRAANERGLPVIVVSNQPSAAKGVVSRATIRQVHDRVLDLLSVGGASIDRSYLCLHHPSGVDPVLGRICDCRKPAPGLLLRAAQELELDLAGSWLIGDTDADLGAARRAALAGVVLIRHPLSAHRRSVAAETADGSVLALGPAVELVLDRMALPNR